MSNLPCFNCKQAGANVRGYCQLCYEYRRRTGRERPRHLIEKALAKAAGIEPCRTDLTDREKECLGLRAQGLNMHQVAAKLFLSTRTVQFHCWNAYEKLEAHNIIQALNALRERESHVLDPRQVSDPETGRR